MTFLVPAVLGGLALSVLALVSVSATRRRQLAGPVQEGSQHRILVHAINDDRCTGCDACVAVCPTNVLDLLDNKSRVVRFQDCIQCEACMWACPTQALVMHKEGTRPPKLEMPAIDENYQTEVPGQYLIGEVAGKPLVKNAANLGRAVVEHILSTGIRPGASARKRAEGSDAKQVRCVDVAIVGSGPGGLSAALSCLQRGLSYVLVEKDSVIASTIAHYPKGKHVMAEPYDVRNLSLLPVFDATKETLLSVWEELVERAGVCVNLSEAVEGITQDGSGVFDVRTNVAAYRAQRVILATGTRGKPRTLGVPGENQAKVRSLLDDPDEFRGQPVLVVGGGDSALEATLSLAEAGARVVLSYRGRAFNRAQPKLRKAVDSYAQQRRIKIKFQSQVSELAKDSVTLMMADGSLKQYPNRAAFVLIGSEPPRKWLAKLGIEFVKRPHSYALARSQAAVERFLGASVGDCPDDAAAAAEVVMGRAAPKRREHSVEAHREVTGARKWLRAATSVFTSARDLDGPMSLSDFAKRNRRGHTGHGRRDELSPRERTRVLRALRDDGARIADEESAVYVVSAESRSSATDAPWPDRRRKHGRSASEWPTGSPVPLAPLPVDEGSAPRQAVIVGLARAMADRPGKRRRVRRSSPPPMRIPRTGAAAQFGQEPTRQVDMAAGASSLLRQAVRRDEKPDLGGFEQHGEATRAIDFDGGSFMSRFDEDNTADSGLLFAVEDHRDAATRAVDVSNLVRLEAMNSAHARGSTDVHDQATRAIDLGRAASLSDIDWDLD